MRLSTLSPGDSALLTMPSAGLKLDPVLSVGGFLDPIFGPGKAQAFLSNLKSASGTLTLGENGVVTGTLTSPTGELFNDTLDLAKLAGDLTSGLTTLNGTLSLDQGIATTDLTYDGGKLTGILNFSDLISSTIVNLVNSLEGTVPFADGKVEVNTPTLVGPITGTIDFGRGAFVTDLQTPFGDLDLTIDFGDDAKIPVEVGGISGVVDLDQGVVSLGSGGFLGNLKIPLTAFSGDFTFSQGNITLDIPTPFGDLTTSFATGAIVADKVKDALQGTGTIVFTNGVAAIDVTGALGTIKTSLDLPKLVSDAASFLAQSQGTVNFNQGIVTTTLTTPTGPFSATYDLNTIALTDSSQPPTLPPNPSPTPTPPTELPSITPIPGLPGFPGIFFFV
ncbi:hypothetical protein ACN4EG_27065 [Alkalinema pantanalense CENA528]|uniref:hypothetical protein n=1 Tax=Alkalinema pantanalense TaxID=1620705 RepID=UPI003D6F308B